MLDRVNFLNFKNFQTDFLNRISNFGNNLQIERIFIFYQFDFSTLSKKYLFLFRNIFSNLIRGHFYKNQIKSPKMFPRFWSFFSMKSCESNFKITSHFPRIALTAATIKKERALLFGKFAIRSVLFAIKREVRTLKLDKFQTDRKYFTKNGKYKRQFRPSTRRMKK